MNRKFKQLIKELRQHKLTAEDKKKGRDELQLFMREHPASIMPDTSWQIQPSRSFFNYFLRPVPAFLAVALFSVSGIAYAAEQSLPGEALYSVKIKVTEPARELIAISPESKAKVHVRLAIRRLEEAGKLAVRSRLNQENKIRLESNFERHAARVEERIEMLKEVDPKAATELSTNFETSLKIHEQILNDVSLSSEGEARTHTEELLDDVKMRQEKAAETRLELELKF